MYFQGLFDETHKNLLPRWCMLRNSIKIIRADFFGDGMTKKVNLVSAVAVKVGLLCVQSGSNRFFSCFQSG